MISKVVNWNAARYIVLTRSFVVAFGCVAIYWGLIELPIFIRETPTQRIASRIIAEQPFKAETLSRQLTILEDIGKSGYCRPVALRSAAIFHIRVMDVAASEPDRQHLDELVKSMSDSVRRSLSCSPADPFLWLVLYWAKNAQNGFEPDNLKYLRMSYQLGPNEGWIGIKRNRLTFEREGSLPPDLLKIAVSEFAELVRAGFYEQTARIFVTLPESTKKLILERLKYIPENYREQFFWTLRGIGYEDPQLLSSKPANKDH